MKSIFSPLSFSWSCLLAVAVAAGVTGCKPDASAPDYPAVAFGCEALHTPGGTERLAVFTTIGDSKVRLAELTACNLLDAANAWPIPADALASVFDAHTLLYARGEGGKVVFYWLKAGNNPPGVAIASYAEGRFQILRPLAPADLTGMYAYATPDSAFVLFLGLQSDSLSATLFRRAGALPDPLYFNQELRTFATQPLTHFVLDLDALAFRSAELNGQINWSESQRQLLVRWNAGHGPVEEVGVFEGVE